MKTMTVDDVLALHPCGRYDRDALKKLFGRRERATLEQIIGCKKVPAEDRLWAALKGPWLDDRQRRLFACDCAERVLPIWEKKYPGDKRPRQTIEVARRFARGEATNEELSAAWDAARAAARDAARDAAWDAFLDWALARICEYAKEGR